MRLKSGVIRLAEREGDSEASYDLAVTTHRFSKRAQEVVDDKLSLSAALMRAGEVDEARRLLAEAEEDLRSQEAALLRQVEELGNFRSMHRRRVVVLERERMSRSSLKRTLAIAVTSSAVVALATMGGAVIGLFEQQPAIDGVNVTPATEGQAGPSPRRITSAGASRGVTVRINGVRVVLTRTEWRALKRAQRTGDDEEVRDLLSTIAPELTVSAPGTVIELIGKVSGAAKDAGDGSTDSGSTSSDSSTSEGGTSSDGGSSTASGDGSGGDDGNEDASGSSKSSGTTEDGGSGEEYGTETGASTGVPDTGDIIGGDTGEGSTTNSQIGTPSTT